MMKYQVCVSFRGSAWMPSKPSSLDDGDCVGQR